MMTMITTTAATAEAVKAVAHPITAATAVVAIPEARPTVAPAAEIRAAHPTMAAEIRAEVTPAPRAVTRILTGHLI